MRRLLCFWAAVSLVAAGCGDSDTDSGIPSDNVTTPDPVAPVPSGLTGEDDAPVAATEGSPDVVIQSEHEELFTFIQEYIEIDRLNNGTSADFGDANLYKFVGTDAQLAACTTGSGADPHDQTCDARLPASQLAACTSPSDTLPCKCTGDALVDPEDCTEVEFIDWFDLLTTGGAVDPAKLEEHRLLDEIKTDPSSFQNDSCVTSTKVLGKMDLTVAAVANNSEYAYMGLKRFDNNGDAGYSWIFNRISPFLDPTRPGCSQGEPLVYELTEGDVLISGNFNPSAGAELIVRRATSFADGQEFLAADVVKPGLLIGGNPVWETVPGTVNLAAVNTTATRFGAMEVISGVDQTGNRTDKGAVSGTAGSFNVGPNIFAEAAVDIEVFAGSNGSLCDLTFWGSVVSQPSSADTADLKDLLGPRLFNFGSLSIDASVAPSCDKEIHLSLDHVTAPGGIDTNDPSTVEGLSCEWTCEHTSGAQKTFSQCSGTLELAPADPTGSWTCSIDVTVADGLGCEATLGAGSVDVYEPLTVLVNTTDYCDSTFDYAATPSGGSGTVTYAWQFTGPPTITPSTTTGASGNASVTDPDNDFTATVTITDSRTDLTGDDACTATNFATAHPLSPVAVTISPSAESLTCPLSDDTITYTAVATGGDGGPYTYNWSGCTSSSGDTCTVNPADSTFCHEQNVYVVADDASTICASDQSETETYSKVTVITSTDNTET